MRILGLPATPASVSATSPHVAQAQERAAAQPAAEPALEGIVVTAQGLTNVVPAVQIASGAGPYNLFYLRDVGSFDNDGPLGTFFRHIGDTATYIARYGDLEKQLAS